MRIGIIQITSESIEPYSSISMPLVKAYAEMHNYGYHSFKVDENNYYHPSWHKVMMILSNHVKIENYDYIMVIDADMHIQRPSIKLETLIEYLINTSLPSKMIHVCSDWANGGLINCGSFIIKNTPDVLSFIKDVWIMKYGTGYERNGLWEQSALVEYINDNPTSNIVNICPMDLFNSYWLNIPKSNFIAHYMARPVEEKVEIFKRI